MGHVGDMEARYSTNKALTVNTIDEMKEAYSKCLPYLETQKNSISDEEQNSIEKSLTGTVLKKVFGYSEDEISELLELSDEDLQKKIQEKLGNVKDAESIRKKAHNDAKEISKRRSGSRQIPIPVGFVEEYMEEGFEFVAGLNGDKAIMRLP